MQNTLRIGQSLFLEGCFTFESSIIGQNLSTITHRLGLPPSRMMHGAYIVYALRIPDISEFELAGITLDSTDKFVQYEQGLMKYDHAAFAKIYSNAGGIPVNFKNIKKLCHNCFGSSKLVKVLPAIPHQVNMYYPPGGMSLQFLMTQKLQCMVVAFIPPNGHFDASINPFRSIS
jgi:hypothetical protein